jgi:mannitol/fructose-specific phosphotransferase system IIA component (Ntr-type)
MSIGKLKTPIDFESIDGAPVGLIVLLASPPDQTGPHIQALAQFSRLMLMDEFRRRIDDAQTPTSLYQVIAEFDQRNPSSL